MAKTSFVLRALSLLGPEEILKLSEILPEGQEQVVLKKAAGEELVSWTDTAVAQPAITQEARVLEFPKKTSITDYEELNTPHHSSKKQEQEEDGLMILHSDLVLWQRELSKEANGPIKKMEAFAGYDKSTQVYMVKSITSEGKKKLKFAATGGVLVNKKQA